MIRNCLTCKKDFKTDNRIAKYCCLDCRFPDRYTIKQCKECYQNFHPKNKAINYCSRKCSVGKSRKPKLRKTVTLICQYCQKQFTKLAYNHKQRPYLFCSRQCSNKGKTLTKIHRSKHEILLFDALVKRYQLNIIHNNREVFDGLEIDIWIPELKLAIEWNGPVHYKPIYGEKTLLEVQTRDMNKQLLANKLDIRMIVIPQLTRMTDKQFSKILISITTIIDQLLKLRD